MKSTLEIYRYTFKYKWTAIKVIFYNILFVIFNVLSLVMFVPFLQIIFPEDPNSVQHVSEPSFDGSFLGFFTYLKEWFNYFMTSLAQEDPKKALFFVVVAVFIAFLLKNLFRYGAIWHQSQLRMAVVRDVREKLFNKAMQLPLSFYTEEKKGDLMARMQSDVGEIELAVVAVLELFFREPISIVIHLIALIYWSPQLTLFSFLILPFSAFAISRIGKTLKRTAKEGQEQMGVLFSTIDEGITGMRIIKAFNAVGRMTNTFQAQNLKHQQLITKAFRKRDLSAPLNETLGVFVMMFIVWYGGSLILDGEQAKGFDGRTFIAFIIVFTQLLRPIQGIATAMGYLNKSKASQDRINQILNADEVIYESKNAVEMNPFHDELIYKNVSFKYKDDYVLKNVSFELKKGKKIALVGESGSGKSTISDLLPRFYEVTDGEITIDGHNVKDVTLHSLREQIGIVTQESILFNASIKENIAFGRPNATDEEIEHAAKIANAHQFIIQLENGYDTNIGERGNKLSGGQKQRISIARAVLKNPAILILDEATSALDTESEKLVQESLESLMNERTSLIIAHRLSTIIHVDEILVLSKGEIVERGTHAELLAKRGMYYNLCSLQGIMI